MSLLITAVHIVSGLLIAAGCFFIIVGAIGIIRMPDIYTRIHAASVIDTGGVTLVILGLFLQGVFIFENPLAAIKLILILLFVNFSAPTASHAIAKMALMGGVVPKGKNCRKVLEESLAFEPTPNKAKGDV